MTGQDLTNTGIRLRNSRRGGKPAGGGPVWLLSCLVKRERRGARSGPLKGSSPGMRAVSPQRQTSAYVQLGDALARVSIRDAAEASPDSTRQSWRGLVHALGLRCSDLIRTAGCPVSSTHWDLRTVGAAGMSCGAGEKVVVAT